MSNLNEQQNELTTFTNARVSRRNLLGMAGQGMLGMALAALLGSGTANAAGKTALERMLPGAKELGARPGAGGVRAMNLTANTLTSLPRVSLPMWGDGIKFNQPEYYETLGAGDLDGDGQDELIIRGPNGLLIQHFDPTCGQWLPLTGNGPALTDAAGWGDPKYYRTIQCTDVDGFGPDEIVARTKDGMLAYKFNTATKEFATLPIGDFFKDSDDGGIWTQEAHYATIKWGKVRSPGYGLQWVIGRHTNGIVAHYYAEEIPGWFEPYFGYGPWPDNDTTTSTNWLLPQYYETIRIADIDGDGQEELLGRSAAGIEVYKFNASNGQWQKIYGGSIGDPTIMSDAAGWNQPQYYTTLQMADIDGDGKSELLARGAAGIVVYKWNSSSNAFYQHSLLEGWTDASGGNNAQYYTTIQCGDVDGDGAAEIVGKSWEGMFTFKYSAASGWYTLTTNNPEWSDDGTDGSGNALADANGTKWDQIEYYSTIKLVRTNADTSTSSVFPNPHCAAVNGVTNRPYATLIGRDKYGIQTWRYLGNSGSSAWAATSAPLPDFSTDPDYLAAYNYLTSYWALADNHPIRWQYNDAEQANFPTWYGIFYKIQPGSFHQAPLTPDLAQPPTVSDPEKWKRICWQLYWELRFAHKVQYWYSTLVGGLINSMASQDNITLNVVKTDISLPSSGGNSFALNVLEIFSNGAWAILGISEFDSNMSSSVAGFIATVAGAALGAETDDGESFDATYGDLEKLILDVQTNETSANNAFQLAVLGGTVTVNNQRQYSPGDFGMLAAIGQCIESTAWSWPLQPNSETPDNTAFVMTGQQAKAFTYYQAMMGASNWHRMIDPQFGPPGGYATKYLYWESSDHIRQQGEWFGTSSSDKSKYVNSTALSDLFDPVQAGHTFPLGIPIVDVAIGQNGWPKLPYKDWDVSTEVSGVLRPKGAAPAIALGELTRESSTGHILLELKVTNEGKAKATNLEITSAQIGSVSALSPLPQHRSLLAPNKKAGLTVRFPASAGTAGKTVVLKIQGKYKGGTFGGTYRVKLP